MTSSGFGRYMRDWTVVGHFDAGHSGFNSEIWGDADQLIQAFRRNAYSSVIFRLTDAEGLDAVKARLESDPRLTVELKRESIFYAEQSEQLSTFIRYLGVTLSIIFSSGATIGAMCKFEGFTVRVEVKRVPPK